MFTILTRRRLINLALACSMTAATSLAMAQVAPDALIQKMSEDMVTTLKTDKAIASGNVRKIASYVDAKIMPNVDFPKMTAAVVGAAWNTASALQKQKLQDEYKLLLVRTYSGALSQFKNETVNILPLKGPVADADLTVKTQIVGRAQPIQLDYRMFKTPTGWKIQDINVAGIWMNASYRNQFAAVAKNQGVEALIDTMHERNASGK